MLVETGKRLTPQERMPISQRLHDRALEIIRVTFGCDIRNGGSAFFAKGNMSSEVEYDTGAKKVTWIRDLKKDNRIIQKDIIIISVLGRSECDPGGFGLTGYELGAGILEKPEPDTEACKIEIEKFLDENLQGLPNF